MQFYSPCNVLRQQASFEDRKKENAHTQKREENNNKKKKTKKERKYTIVSKQRNMIFSSIPTLLKINLSHLELYIK